MSYSFVVTAATKADAKTQVEAELDKVVASQAIHARDKPAALASVGAAIDLLADDDTRDVMVSCNGFLNWSYTQAPDGTIAAFDATTAPLTGVGMTVSASHSPRSVQPAPVENSSAS